MGSSLIDNKQVVNPIIDNMIRIQTASVGDIEALTRIEVDTKLQSFPEYMDMIATDFDIRQHRWHTYFNQETPVSAKPQRIVYKAIKEGEIVGYIAGHLTTRYNKDAEIQSLYVLKSEQRNGIGSLLFKKFAAWLDKHGAESLCTGIFPENPYLVFYLKYGGMHLNPHWIYWDDLSLLQQKLGLP